MTNPTSPNNLNPSPDQSQTEKDEYTEILVEAQKQEDLQKALELYNKAIQLSPELPIAYMNKGYALYKAHEYQTALEAFQKAISPTTPNIEVLSRMSDCFAEVGNQKECLEYLEKAIFLEPDYSETYNLYGERLLEAERYKDALSAYEKAES